MHTFFSNYKNRKEIQVGHEIVFDVLDLIILISIDGDLFQHTPHLKQVTVDGN